MGQQQDKSKISKYMVKHLVIKSVMFPLVEWNSVFVSLAVHGTTGYGQKKKW